MKVDDRFIVQKMSHVNVIQIITSFSTLFLDLSESGRLINNATLL